MPRRNKEYRYEGSPGDGSSKRYRDGFSEREFEKRVEERRLEEKRQEARRRARRPDAPRDDEKPGKAPLLLRVLAWCGVILLCFVTGYVGTNYVLNFLGNRIFLNPDGRVTNQQELQALLSADVEDDALIGGTGVQKIALSLVYPKDGVLKTESADIVSQILEDDIREAVHRLVELSGLFGRDVRLLHVFRNADTVYLDFTSGFLSALTTAGSRTGTLFITGIVRTLQDNFPPVTRVRFLVDSKVASSGAPVDLTATWQLPK